MERPHSQTTMVPDWPAETGIFRPHSQAISYCLFMALYFLGANCHNFKKDADIAYFSTGLSRIGQA
ncbi:hypothetical protein [Thermogutta sp.]|uniref:hypothetical protein n=1 Tax=Thermogutta sp. TaxID=1962930 RepID=UPI00321FBD86